MFVFIVTKVHTKQERYLITQHNITSCKQLDTASISGRLSILGLVKSHCQIHQRHGVVKSIFHHVNMVIRCPLIFTHTLSSSLITYPVIRPSFIIFIFSIHGKKYKNVKNKKMENKKKCYYGSVSQFNCVRISAFVW